jgi:hypothetical protein
MENFSKIPYRFAFSLVEERCYPYQYRNEKCRIRSFTNLITAYCAPRRGSRTELYKIDAIYTLRSESDIMIEIYKNGPVQGESIFGSFQT